MQELEITIKVRNNRLKERRTALGFSQAQLAEAVGLTLAYYGALECMRRSPRAADGRWSDAAIQLANFHCVEPEELFPPVTEAVETATVIKKLDANDLPKFLSDHQVKRLSGVSTLVETKELSHQVRRVLDTLAPREELALRLRFGLTDEGEHTLREAGDHIKVGPERMRQIQNKALRKLRHPSRAKRLRPFVDPEQE